MPSGQLGIRNYQELYQWSLEQPGDFWYELARFAGVRASWGAGRAIEDGQCMPGARFFPTARLNFAEICCASTTAIRRRVPQRARRTSASSPTTSRSTKRSRASPPD
jgi:hypothetical protein